MRNVTLAIDEETLEAGRRYARERGMSFNSLIRELLQRVLGKSGTAWLDDCFRISDDLKPSSGGKAWKREDLYDG